MKPYHSDNGYPMKDIGSLLHSVKHSDQIMNRPSAINQIYTYTRFRGFWYPQIEEIQAPIMLQKPVTR